MKVTHKILESGHHCVCATGYHHLFAQWPVGTELKIEDISSAGCQLSEETANNFVSLANQVANYSASEKIG